MSEQLYPKPEKTKDYHLEREWIVDYALVYDDGVHEWSHGYHFKWWAKYCAWWNYHISSYGGSAILRLNGKREGCL